MADTQSETSILNLAERVAQISDTKIIYELPDVTESAGYSNVKQSVMDAAKLENLVWIALTPLKDGGIKTHCILT